jgi:hypothetical protein
MNAYFSLQKKLKINENYLYELSKNTSLSRKKQFLYLIVLLPFALLGFIHCGLPYYGVKKFVEGSFKRKVFWGSVKLLLGMIAMGLLNIPFIFLFEAYIYPSYLLGTLYYALIGLFGLAAYMWWTNLVRFREKGIVSHMDLSKMILKRESLIQKIKATIPVA